MYLAVHDSKAQANRMLLWALNMCPRKCSEKHVLYSWRKYQNGPEAYPLKNMNNTLYVLGP